MKLAVKISDAASVPGGKAILLCDERGDALPQQLGCILEQTVGEASILTVRFRLDGKQIVML